MNSAANIFKKLKLIDEQEIQRLVEKQLKEYDPVLRTLGKLQREMDSVLDRDDLSAEDKQGLYQANLGKFLSMKNISGTSKAPTDPTPPPLLPTPTIAVSTTSKSAAEASPKADSHSDISISDPAPAAHLESNPDILSNSLAVKDQFDEPLKTVSIDFNKIKGLKPTSMTKVNNLKELIESNPNRMRVKDDTGEIIIDGNVVENSSFYDLIKSLYVDDKKSNLTGNRKFLDTLSNMINSDPQKIESANFVSRRDVKKILDEIGSASMMSTSSATSTSSSSLSQKGSGHFENRKRKEIHPISTGKKPPGKAIKVLYLY